VRSKEPRSGSPFLQMLVPDGPHNPVAPNTDRRTCLGLLGGPSVIRRCVLDNEPVSCRTDRHQFDCEFWISLARHLSRAATFS